MKHLFAFTIILECLAGACWGETISGRVSDASSGRPLSGMLVVAASRRNAQIDRGVTYTSRSAPDGAFVLTVPPDQYTLCVGPRDPYLDPCLWDTPILAKVDTGQSITVPIAINAGGKFIVRIHNLTRNNDLNPLNQGTFAELAGAGGKPVILPVEYVDAQITDLGLYVPFNVRFQLKVRRASGGLVDSTGRKVTPAAEPVTVLPSDVQAVKTADFFGKSPDAKVVHYYVTNSN